MSIATLAYSPLVPATATASSAAANYPATNVLLGKVNKPWRSTSNATTEYLIIDLGSSSSYPSNTLCISGLTMPNAAIYADNSANPSTLKGTFTCAADTQGRYKVSLPLPGTYRYIKIKPNSGTPTDGASYWTIGTVDLFTSSMQFARDPIYGESQIETHTPQSSVQLENGVTVKDDTGPSYSAITLNFSGGSTDDHEAIMRRARAGLCWLDLGVIANRGLQWRVKHIEPKTTRKITAFNRETVQIVLTEQV